MPSNKEVFSRPVSAVMRQTPLACTAATGLAELIARMNEAEASSAVIVDAERRVAGVVTEHDVVHRIAFKASAETAAGQVMTVPVLTVRATEYLYRAIALMRRRRLHHLPVVDEAARLVGMLHLDDALAAASSHFLRQIDDLTQDDTVDGLRRVKRAQADFAFGLMQEAMPAPDVQALLTDVNNDIYSRLADIVAAAMAEDGWGVAPVPFAVIVMGSGGRGESFLLPDQDNGFILADYPDSDHNVIDSYFIELATRLTRDLAAVGFPYCNGNVMATNPLWRKTLPQWCRQVDNWGRKRSEVALLYADIFFDFRGVHGEREMAAALRAHAVTMAKDKPQFLRALTMNESHHSAGLSWFDRLVTDNREGPHKGELNLKSSGTLPLVESTRLYALREGIDATSTIARIQALGDAGVFSDDERDYLTGAFTLVTTLLLRQQVADTRDGIEPSNYVAPNRLSSREKDMLVDGLKAVEDLARRAKADFTGQIL